MRPGIIPLRPLTLSDLYNGAVGYIRANPKVTLGLTAIIVVVTALINLVLMFGLTGIAGSVGMGLAWVSSFGVSAVSNVLLIGTLTIVVGRAVFGSTISFNEAWEVLRPRFLPLLGLTALLSGAMALVVGIEVVFVISMGAAGGTAAALTVAVPLFLATGAAIAYAYTVLCFAPAIVVLERQPVVAAMRRSFALARNDFWRIFGILLLTAIIAGLISMAVTFPFGIADAALSGGARATGLGLFGAIGGMLSRIIVLPFTAGVTVLLYADRRIRAEAFDLVLRTGAGGAPQYGASTDGLWLTPPPR